MRLFRSQHEVLTGDIIILVEVHDWDKLMQTYIIMCWLFSQRTGEDD